MKKVLLFLPLLFSLVGCAENDPENVEFQLKQFENPVSIHTEEQKSFFKETDFSNNLTKYGLGEEEKTIPLPVSLNWSVIKARNYIVKVSEKEDMSDSWEFTTKKMQFDLYNCKVNTTYYWTVSSVYKSNTFTSEVASFKTANDGARNIYADGVNNIRDLGGYALEGGKTFKQGMIYRSAKFNESSESSIIKTITEKGIDTLINQLGIKSDIDLRKVEAGSDGKIETSGLTSSPLGSTVSYVNCPMYYDGSTVISHTSGEKDTYNKTYIKKMFDYMAEENNYPMIFHCTQGKDRTGAIAYLLESLLGVSSDDKARDYLFTNMSSIGGGACKYSAITNGYNVILKKYEGSNIQEQANNYLLSIGVSQTNIDKIIDLLTY